MDGVTPFYQRRDEIDYFYLCRYECNRTYQRRYGPDRIYQSRQRRDHFAMNFVHQINWFQNYSVFSYVLIGELINCIGFWVVSIMLKRPCSASQSICQETTCLLPKKSLQKYIYHLSWILSVTMNIHWLGIKKKCFSWPRLGQKWGTKGCYFSILMSFSVSTDMN